MADAVVLVTLASTGTLGLALAAGSALRSWQDWLEVKRLGAGKAQCPGRYYSSAGRELAKLRERVRRLEAIADGEPQELRP